MLTKNEVKKIAKLARLGISEDEIGKYQKDLSAILDFVDQLKEVDVEGVEPTFQASGIFNIVRDDEALIIDRDDKVKKKEELLNLAPDKQGGHIKVKKVF